MSTVLLSGVSYAWDSRVVLRDVDLHLTPGWTGLVGANGAGKSTLLALIDGSLRPDSGSVRVDGTLVRADQQDARGEVLGLAQDWRRAAVRWRARLRLDPDDLDRWDTLSPGQRRRWVVGAALASEADVLLLDEPTNHLDAEARALLVNALHAWHGTGVIVAHDRALLDAVTTRTARIHLNQLTVWEGNYSAARVQWEQAARQRTDALNTAQASRRAAERRLADARRDRDATTAQTTRSGRMRNAHDSDARTITAGTLASWADTRAGRRVELARRDLDRQQESVDAQGIERSFGRPVFVGYQRSAKARIASFTGPLIAGDRLLAQVDVTVHREDHVRIAGANGAGKTTLLRALLGDSPGDDVLILPQVILTADAIADLAQLRALPSDARGRVLQHVAALGVDPTQLLTTQRPSPGEARKLRLALGLGRQVAALFLDEPTNELDLPAIERLELTLSAWPGALVLITHDDRFAASCTAVTWDIVGSDVQVTSHVSPGVPSSDPRD